MSLTLTLTGKSNELSRDYFPPIELGNDNYEIGLINFHTYNSIPNIEEPINKFYFNNEVIPLPIGSYEVTDINNYLRFKLGDPKAKDVSNFEQILSNEISNNHITLQANNSTLKCEIASTGEIDFTPDDCIGGLLGFSKRKLKPNTVYISDFPANIVRINSLIVQCNIVTGAFLNEKLVHTIHEFYPAVPPGYKIVETPQNVVYLPVNVRAINNVSLYITDQDGNLVNFREEIITIRLHVRKI